MQSAKQLTCIGIFYLEEAGLDVLFHARESQEAPFVTAAEIRRRIGLDVIDRSSWIIRGLLQKLGSEGLAERREERGPSKLTEVGYQRRCEK